MKAHALLLTLALVTGSAATAFAHAVVFPPEAPLGAYQKYVLRVPNERGSATTRVHIVFPRGVRVISFDEVPGWTLDPTSDDGGATYVEATWTGVLPVGRFVEFAFIGVNPSSPTTLKWDAVQEYADGTTVEWTGPPESSTPASLTIVGAASAPDAPGARSSGALLGAVAIGLALLSLGLALRPRSA